MASHANGLSKVMTYLMWISLLGLLTLFFNRYLHPNADINKNSNLSGEVRLKADRYGHYVAPGFINDEPVRFLLDSGATSVSIPAQLASRLGLQRGARGEAMTANGVVTIYRTQLNSVRLGGVELYNVSASINPGMTGEQVLLGMSFMRHLDLTQRNGELTLKQR